MKKPVIIPFVPQSIRLMITGRGRAETSDQQTFCCYRTRKTCSYVKRLVITEEVDQKITTLQRLDRDSSSLASAPVDLIRQILPPTQLSRPKRRRRVWKIIVCPTPRSSTPSSFSSSCSSSTAPWSAGSSCSRAPCTRACHGAPASTGRGSTSPSRSCAGT